MENITADRIAYYRRQAEELRAEGNRTADLSLRMEFAGKARRLEQLAENLERVARRAIEH